MQRNLIITLLVGRYEAYLIPALVYGNKKNIIPFNRNQVVNELKGNENNPLVFYNNLEIDRFVKDLLSP